MKKVSARLRQGAATLAVFAVGAASAAGNLVVNGSFDEPDLSVSQAYSCFTNVTIANWTHSQGTGGHGSCDIQQNTGVFAAADSGEQLLYLNDYGAAGTGIAQSLTLTFGTTYQLTFQVSGVKAQVVGSGTGGRATSDTASMLTGALLVDVNFSCAAPLARGVYW